MGSAVKILPHYTYNDYLHWEGRWEIIDGIPYAKSSSPLPKHQRLAGSVGSEFRFQLKGLSRCVAYMPIDYLVAEDTILQPDMLIVCGEIVKDYLDFAPALVAEILSPGTELIDRYTKYDIYESQKIPYYIIVAPETEEVEVYELKNGLYELAQKGHAFDHSFSFGSCTAAINFGQIW